MFNFSYKYKRGTSNLIKHVQVQTRQHEGGEFESNPLRCHNQDRNCLHTNVSVSVIIE